jgi:polysaccharide biosynthesis protein PslH
MKSLMVTQYVPFPADSGGKQRALAFLLRLARRGSTTVVAFDDGRADTAGLERHGVQVRAIREPPGRMASLVGSVRTGSVYAGRSWSRALDRLVGECAEADLDVLFVEATQMAPYAEAVKAQLRVLDMQNVESALVRAHAATRGGLRRPAYRVESLALRRWEKRIRSRFDAVCVVSSVDRERLPAGSSHMLVCPNGCEPTPPLPPSEEPTVAFVALLSWAPNVDAARWLTTEIWPRVQADVPGARLLLVGRDPDPTVSALAGPSVEVSGTVADVRPWLARSAVGLAPLRSGGGSRLKILESLDAGRPVVATSIGAEGLDDLVGEGVVVTDRAEEFAGEVVGFLRDPARAREVGLRGRRAVHARYTWDSTLAPLFTWLDAACP